MFHMTFGYYAQEVGPKTAVLPAGWEERLFPVIVRYEKTKMVTGYCLEVYDLAVAKYAAGREKDYLFLAVMINKGMLRKKELISRVHKTALIDRQLVIEKIKRDYKAYASKHMEFGKLVEKPRIDSKPDSDNQKNKTKFLKNLKRHMNLQS